MRDMSKNINSSQNSVFLMLEELRIITDLILSNMVPGPVIGLRVYLAASSF